MPDDPIYRELQQHLDRMPVGFPATQSGVEIRILKQLFSPLEARVALCLSMAPEPVATIHKRLDLEMTGEALAGILHNMAYRGLILSNTRHGEPRYGKLPFVIGIYEGQVNRMTGQLARDLIEYFDEGLWKSIRPKTTPQLRTVPVNREIEVERGVVPYDDIRAAVRDSPGPFAVMNCICRQAKDLAGDPCRQTSVRENCLTMGSAAKVMLGHGQARQIAREEMLELLDGADREGLVLQPQNTRNPQFVCCCCGCCCVALGAAKKLDRPVEFFSSNYYADVNPAECQACGECADRCQMEAVAVREAAAAVDLTRCIGCGLCVTTCPSGAMALHRTPEETAPPAGTDALYKRIYRERYGILGYAKAAVRMMTRSRL
jgi:ferredoxin